MDDKRIGGYMSEKSTIIWEKVKGEARTYGFKYSEKLSGAITQKSFWGTECKASMGNREIAIRRDPSNKRYLNIYDAKTDKTLARVSVYWKDFQRNKLEFEDGSVFYLRSYDLFRGAWSWIREDSHLEQFVFRVDGLLHRSGRIENNSKDLTPVQRDVLLLSGLHLQHFFNTWLTTIAILLIVIITDH